MEPKGEFEAMLRPFVMMIDLQSRSKSAPEHQSFWS